MPTGRTAAHPRFLVSNGKRLATFALIALALVLAVRVGWSAWVAHAHPEAVVTGDTPDYLGSARALVENRSFDRSPDDDTPQFLRTPGYPVLLATILWATNSEWSISPIQALLSGVAIVGTFLIGRRMIGVTAGLVAGAVVALDPLQFALSGTVLTETVATIVLLGMVAAAGLVFARAPERVRPRDALLLGATIAAATIVRPTTYYFPVIVVAMLAIRFRRQGWRPIVALMLAFTLPIVLVVGGWMLRNHDTLDSWQISGSQSLASYCWHAAEATARAEGIGMREAREQLECDPDGGVDIVAVCPSWWACDVPRPGGHGPSWDEMNRRAVDILTDHPVESAEVFLRGVALVAAAPGTDTVARFLNVQSSVPLAAVLFVWNATLWILAMVGAVVGVRSRHRWFWAFVSITIVYVVLVSAGGHASSRFRTPIVPLFALLAALGLRTIVLWLRERRGPSASSSTTRTESDEGRPQL